MKFSEAWLREWVDPDIDSAELMSLLTMAGLEVDGHEPVARASSGIVVGEVTSVEPHPDADKLSLCQVSDGSGNYQVVCGAPNVRAGLKVPFARVGAEIVTGDGSPFVIEAARLRGVESKGMLCSAEELGLEEASDGLLELPDDAAVGMDIREQLQLDDISIELDLTPNRGDCLGMLGLSRELGVLTATDVRVPEYASVTPSIDDEFPVKITAGAECPRYLGRIIRNINLDAESPHWMREKLRRSGLRSIDPIVDVTNFVLMELGQPMHAFDYGKLTGHIDVRLARKTEKITLLDGKELTLSPDTLVIADADKAVAMAGIMGGLDTAVSESTRDVFLECAFFAPLAVSGRARAYGMQTDASHRYERGVDYELQGRAMERATELLLQIVGGEAGPVTEAVGELPAATDIKLGFESVTRVLGIQMSPRQITDILGRLGFEILEQDATGISIRVPSFRFDIAIEADLIEELARVFGYNNIPASSGAWQQRMLPRAESRVSLGLIKQHLVALGYQEVISYSFISESMAGKFCDDDSQLVRLQNPLSQDMAVMRPSILPGLLAALVHNAARQQGRVRLFESGQVFHKSGSHYVQLPRIAGLVTGRRNPENWNNNNEISDFYDLKGDVESLLGLGGDNGRVSFIAQQIAGAHPGQCARIEGPAGTIGVIAALHPAIQAELELGEPVYLFDLALETLSARAVPRARELSKYPQVSRDLAIVVEEAVTAEAILATVRKYGGDALTDLRIFDVYQGDAIEKGKKSLALGLTWQHPSRTLSDEEINTIISSCVNALQKQFNANLRK